MEDIILGVVLIALFIFWAGGMTRGHDLMKEAYELGYAVECIGERGYHWKCEE